MLHELIVMRGSFVATSMKYNSAVIRKEGHSPAGMITDSIPHINQHVTLFWGLAPVLALTHLLESIALGMEEDLVRGAPHSFVLVVIVARVVFDSVDFDVIDPFEVAFGTTKALGRRSMHCTATAPFHDEISCICDHCQVVEEPIGDDMVGLVGIGGSSVCVSHFL